MQLLQKKEFSSISGGTHIIYTEEHKNSGVRSYIDGGSLTCDPNNPSALPIEIQQKLDAGASFKSLETTIIAYNLALEQFKRLHPEVFN